MDTVEDVVPCDAEVSEQIEQGAWLECSRLEAFASAPERLVR